MVWKFLFHGAFKEYNNWQRLAKIRARVDTIIADIQTLIKRVICREKI